MDVYKRVHQSFALLIHVSNLLEYSSAFLFSRVGDLKLFFTKKGCSWGEGGGGRLGGKGFLLSRPNICPSWGGDGGGSDLQLVGVIFILAVTNEAQKPVSSRSWVRIPFTAAKRVRRGEGAFNY